MTTNKKVVSETKKFRNWFAVVAVAFAAAAIAAFVNKLAPAGWLMVGMTTASLLGVFFAEDVQS